MRPVLKITPSNPQAESGAGIGKLVAFAGLEAGAGKAFCAASIARCLAHRWRCLAIELDNRGHLQSYFALKPTERKVLASFEDLSNSLEPLKTRTTIDNLAFIGWPGGFPQIERFLGTLRSDPADYVFATLSPGSSDDALDLFAVADVPVIVIQPAQSNERILEFLQRLGSRHKNRRDIYLLLNQVRRGGEEREVGALIEKVRVDLAINLNLLGIAIYDPQAAASFLHGATVAAFEDIALQVQRLLPRTTPLPDSAVTAGNGKKRTGVLSAVMSPFGGKRRRLEEKLRQRDVTINTLRRRHENTVDDLQDMLKQKNESIAEKSILIEGLEEAVQRYTQQLLEQNKRIAELDSGAAARQRELERSLKQIRDAEEANEILAKEKAALVHENEIASLHLTERTASLSSLEETAANLRRELHLALEEKSALLLERTNQIQNLESVIGSQRIQLNDLQDQIHRLEESNENLLQDKAALQAQKDGLEIELERTSGALREHQVEHEQVIGRLTDRLSERKNDIVSLENRVAVQQDQIQKLVEQNAALQDQNDNLEFAHDDVEHKLGEAEALIRERDLAIECKDLLIRELGDRFDRLSSGHETLASRTSEALQHLYDELRLNREESMATIEKWHGLVCGMDERMTVQRLEKMLSIVEQDNYHLKFNLMAVLESTVRRPGPEALIRERDGLVSMLRLHPGQTASVIAVDEGGRESFDLAIELRSILETAGWNVKFMTSSFENGQLYGLQIVRDGSEAANSAARILSDALEKSGFAFTAITAPSPQNLSPLRLIVGKSN